MGIVGREVDFTYIVVMYATMSWLNRLMRRREIETRQCSVVPYVEEEEEDVFFVLVRNKRMSDWLLASCAVNIRDLKMRDVMIDDMCAMAVELGVSCKDHSVHMLIDGNEMYYRIYVRW